jgi:hypothetical protein
MTAVEIFRRFQDAQQMPLATKYGVSVFTAHRLCGKRVESAP